MSCSDEFSKTKTQEILQPNTLYMVELHLYKFTSKEWKYTGSDIIPFAHLHG